MVQGCPSDHFRPLRKWNVHSEASSLDSHDSARPGPDILPVVEEAQYRVAVAELTVRTGRGHAARRECEQLQRAAVLAGLHPPVRDDVRTLGQPLLNRGRPASSRLGACWYDPGGGSGSVTEPLARLSPPAVSWPEGPLLPPVHDVNARAPAAAAVAWRKVRRLSR
ncbi:hypothetical protein GCM10028864_47220 [Microlunatus parietis]